MGPSAQHYLTGGAAESGGARRARPRRSALCLGVAGLPGGLGAALGAAVSECLAPGSQGSKGSTSASSGARFLFGRENRKTPHPPPQEMVLFLQHLFRWPPLEGGRPGGGGSWGLGLPNPVFPSSEPRRRPGACHSKPHLTSMVNLGLATGDTISRRCIY